MTTKNQTHFVKDLANKKIRVTRNFNAPLDIVWKAWTVKEVLDQWWAPKPWKAKTKSIQFVTGGHWLYAMTGPNNECHWSKANFISVVPMKSFHGKDIFCDEDGNPMANMPTTEWNVTFIDGNEKTTVNVELTFESEEQLNQLVKMGFEQGFTMAHDNLDQYLLENYK